MNVPALLAELHGRGIRLWADGQHLRCNAPAGEMTSELQAELALRKHDILAFLRTADTLGRTPRAIIPLQPKGARTPIFAVAGHNGDVFCYRALARHLGEDQPFYGLQPPGLDCQSKPLFNVVELAAYFATQIRTFQSDAPCVVAGFCAGGSIAFELARQLAQAGTPIAFVALFGAPYPSRYRRWVLLQEQLESQWQRVAKHVRTLVALPWPERKAYLVRKLRDRETRIADELPSETKAVLRMQRKVEEATLAAARRYAPSPFAGRLILFLPSKSWTQTRNEPLRWERVAGSSERYFGPDECNSDNMLREPFAKAFATLYRAHIDGTTAIQK